MLTSLQLWRNLKPLDLDQNLLGGFVLIPFFQVCFFILMYFDSFGECSLHLWFRLKCWVFSRIIDRFQGIMYNVFQPYEIWEFCAIFSVFWEKFDEFRFAVRICCQTERQKLRVQDRNFLIKKITQPLSQKFDNSMYYVYSHFQWFALKWEFLLCNSF